MIKIEVHKFTKQGNARGLVFNTSFIINRTGHLSKTFKFSQAEGQIYLKTGILETQYPTVKATA